MKFDRGDVVHYGDKIAIIVDKDRARRQYQLQLDSKGEQLVWVDVKEVH